MRIFVKGLKTSEIMSIHLVVSLSLLFYEYARRSYNEEQTAITRDGHTNDLSHHKFVAHLDAFQ